MRLPTLYPTSDDQCFQGDDGEKGDAGDVGDMGKMGRNVKHSINLVLEYINVTCHCRGPKE